MGGGGSLEGFFDPPDVPPSLVDLEFCYTPPPAHFEQNRLLTNAFRII